MILETQQSSDVTYRFYDYDRLADGKPRPLHIAQSLDVTQVPHCMQEPERETNRQGGCDCDPSGDVSLLLGVPGGAPGPLGDLLGPTLCQCQRSGGSGRPGRGAGKKGDHFIIPAGYGKMVLEGELELIYSHL